MVKKVQSITRPHQRVIKTKAGATKIVHVQAHLNKLTPKKKK